MYRIYDDFGRFLFGIEKRSGIVSRGDAAVYGQTGREIGYGVRERDVFMSDKYTLYSDDGTLLGSLHRDLNGKDPDGDDYIMLRAPDGRILARIRAESFGEYGIRQDLLGSRAERATKEEGSNLSESDKAAKTEGASGTDGNSHSVDRSGRRGTASGFSTLMATFIIIWWFALIYVRFDDRVDGLLRVIVGHYLAFPIGFGLVIVLLTRLKGKNTRGKLMVLTLSLVVMVFMQLGMHRILAAGHQPLKEMLEEAVKFTIPLFIWDICMGIVTRVADRRDALELAEYAYLMVNIWHNLYLFIFMITYTLALYRVNFAYMLLGGIPILVVSIALALPGVLSYRVLAGSEHYFVL